MFMMLTRGGIDCLSYVMFLHDRSMSGGGFLTPTPPMIKLTSYFCDEKTLISCFGLKFEIYAYESGLKVYGPLMLIIVPFDMVKQAIDPYAPEDIS